MTITIFLTAHLPHDPFLPGKVELELDDPRIVSCFFFSKLYLKAWGGASFRFVPWRFSYLSRPRTLPSIPKSFFVRRYFPPRLPLLSLS